MSGDYINEQTKITLALPNIALSTTLISAAVDRANFGSLTFAVGFATTLATAVQATISLLAGATATATTPAAAADTIVDSTASQGGLAGLVKKISYIGSARYAAVSVSPAAATTGTCLALAIQGGPRKSPQS